MILSSTPGKLREDSSKSSLTETLEYVGGLHKKDHRIVLHLPFVKVALIFPFYFYHMLSRKLLGMGRF